MSKYVLPKIKYAEKHDNLNKNPIFSTDVSYIDNLESILSLRRTCVVAEPGYGKTRLLLEIFTLCENHGMNCAIIDLKKVDGGLDTFLQNIVTTSKYSFEDDGIDVSEKFELSNLDDVVVCLDALDEVEYSNFNKVVDLILDFLRVYTNIRLVISCRGTFMASKAARFEKNMFQFLSIEKFADNEVKEYFAQNSISDEIINNIFNLVHSNNDMCIRVPRYLMMTVELVKDNDVDISKLTKSDVFEKFIYQKLEKEDDVIKQEHKDIVKRLLEQLALVMGIYQKSTITKDEFMTFLNDIESGLKNYFIENIKLQDLFKRSLLKDNINTIVFENTEFREYLAAKEITRLGNVEQVIFDLAINVNRRDIYPSWYNTIKFLIDFQPSLLAKVIQFGKTKVGEFKSSEYFRFLVNVQADRVSGNDKKDIFITVFKYYQSQAYGIDNDILSALVNYFDRSCEPILKEYMNERISTRNESSVRLGNVLMFLYELIENNTKEIDVEYWKSTIVELTIVKNDVVKRTSIRILGLFKDINLLIKVFDNVKDGSKMVWENLIEGCTRANPNDPFSVKCMVTGVRNGYWYVRSNLSLITEPEALKVLLEYFISDKEFMVRFIENGETEEKQDLIIINHLKENWDDEITCLSEQVVVKAITDFDIDLRKSKFIIGLAKILNETVDDYLINLLMKGKDSNTLWLNLLYLCAVIIKVEQVYSFVTKAKELNESMFLVRVLEASRYLQDDKKELVYEEGRKYLEKEYSVSDEKSKSKDISISESTQKLYNEFKYKLEPEKGKYQSDLFQFIIKNQEKLIPIIKTKPSDEERIKHLIKNFINTIDTSEYELNIEIKDGADNRDGIDSSRIYHANFSVTYIDSIINLAKILNIDMRPYRKELISLIPYTMNRTLDDIFELIPNPSDEEVDFLLSIYNTPRKDDILEFQPSNFIKAFRKYKLISATPIIKGFIENTKVSIYDKILAIKAIGDCNNDPEYIQELFLRYIKETKEESKELSELCNEILIEKYNEKDAILWRLKSIKNRAFELEKEDESFEARFIHDTEVELFSKNFAAPIMKVNDEEFKDAYYDLLSYSFDIIKKSSKYRSYSNYIWDIALKYFENLKITGKSKYLLELEMWINEKTDSLPDINWFKYRIQELRRIYLNETDKPITMYECVKRYNKIKHDNYLDISCSKDLVELIQDIIDTDLRKWVEMNGAYKFIEESIGNQETMIQKTIKTQFENALLRRGVRDVGIIREPQLLNDIRPDFLISYGFVGSVVLEIKRVENAQVKNEDKRKEYATKLIKYIEGTKSDYLVYLLFNTKKEDELERYLPEVVSCYQENTRIFVKGLNCIRP